MAVYIFPPSQVTIPPIVGGATSANQVLEIAELTDINSELDGQTTILSAIATEAGEINTKTPALVGGKVPVDTGLSQGLTDTQLRATPVPVSGTISTGGLTDAELRATPVPVSGTVAVTGVATAANQTTGNSSLSSIDGKTPALGQALSAASVPVVLPAAQITTLTPPAAITGFNLETTQTAMSAKLPASLGAKTGANSLSIVPASDASFATSPSSVAGTITSNQITVGTSAVRATVSGSAPSASRKKLMVKPSKNNSGSIYIGGSTVTTANGMEVIGPDRLEFEFDAGDYYLISDTAAQVVEIVEKV